jgi:hypothetical protein
MDKVICSPDDYYGDAFSSFIKKEYLSNKHSWIYHIIEKGCMSRHEKIFIDNKDWCLCADKHHGNDLRYLVVFKDEKLKTIRELEALHLNMLENVLQNVTTWLATRHTQKYYFYFHYMPSVLQLHMHVNSNTQHINYDRAHFLHNILRNLRHNSAHYGNALILTKYCSTLRRAEVHTKLTPKICMTIEPCKNFRDMQNKYKKEDHVAASKHTQNSL